MHTQRGEETLTVEVICAAGDHLPLWHLAPLIACLINSTTCEGANCRGDVSCCAVNYYYYHFLHLFCSKPTATMTTDRDARWTQWRATRKRGGKAASWQLSLTTMQMMIISWQSHQIIWSACHQVENQIQWWFWIMVTVESEFKVIAIGKQNYSIKVVKGTVFPPSFSEVN